MTEIDLNKQRALNADPKAIQQINFTGIVAWDPNANTTMVFIIEEANETVLDFLTRNCESIINVFHNLFWSINITLLNITL